MRPQVHLLMGKVYRKLGRAREAMQHFSAASGRAAVLGSWGNAVREAVRNKER